MKKAAKMISEQLKSIRFTFMLLLLCTNFVVIFLIAIGSYLAYSNSFIREIGTNRSDVLSQIGGRVQDFKSNAYTISNLYNNDAGFIRYSRTLSADNREAFSQYMDNLTRQYKVSFNQVNLDYSVVYLSKSGIGYCSDSVPADYDYQNPEIRIWYKDLYQAKGGIIDVANYKDRTLGTASFIAARTVLAPNGEILGYLMVNVNEQQIYRTYADVIAPSSNIYITDSNGYIISSNVRQIVGFQYFSMHNLDKLFGTRVYAIVPTATDKALFTKHSNGAYGFTVFEETALEDLLEPIRTTRNIVVFLTLGVTLLGVLLAWVFSGRVARPILALRDYVLVVEGGDLNATFSLNSYREINTLSNGIQQMLARIRALMASEKKKEEQKRKMQYHMLQAQINPHFMYNTLFSIKCVVDMNENEKASKMLSAFIQLLRSSLTNPETLVSIRSQMEALKQYAELQRFRYGDCFDVIVEYDDAVGDCLLPSLLVQPLVENAIVHGVEQAQGYGVIAVSVREKKGQLVIEVEDNGAGMTAAQIVAAFTQESSTEKPHIGLSNINERIRLIFGERYGLQVESQPGDGTKIMLNVPIVREEREVDL